MKATIKAKPIESEYYRYEEEVKLEQSVYLFKKFKKSENGEDKFDGFAIGR